MSHGELILKYLQVGLEYLKTLSPWLALLAGLIGLHLPQPAYMKPVASDGKSGDGKP